MRSNDETDNEEGKPKTPTLIAFASGAAFGVASLVVGHPLETVKAKMQTMTEFEGQGALSVARRTLTAEGIVGLYRGALPPLLISSVLRSLQFGCYSAAMDGFVSRGWGGAPGEPPTHTLLGVDARIWAAGVVSGASRNLVETQFETLKIRRQTGKAYAMRGLMNGFWATLYRNVTLLTAFFVYSEWTRELRDQTGPTASAFLRGSLCATGAWITSYPFDIIKSNMNRVEDVAARVSVREAAARIVRANGVGGLFRGIGPCVVRSLITNGIAMTVYVKTEELLVKAFVLSRGDDQ